jgi:hypothetical protein
MHFYIILFRIQKFMEINDWTVESELSRVLLWMFIFVIWYNLEIIGSFL